MIHYHVTIVLGVIADHVAKVRGHARVLDGPDPEDVKERVGEDLSCVGLLSRVNSLGRISQIILMVTVTNLARQFYEYMKEYLQM